MPKNRYDLEFQPERKGRKEALLHFLLGFLAILLLLGVTSAYLAHRDGLLDMIIGTYLNPTEPETTAEAETWHYTGTATFLLCGTDAAKQELRFVCLAQADAEYKRIHLLPLSPKDKTTLAGQETTLGAALKEGGVKQLKLAAEQLTGAVIDRYISGDDNGFVKAINTMGSVTVKVEERIRYRSSAFGITLAEGSQRLQGDMLLRYFRYLGTLKEGAAEAQAELLKLLLEHYLTAGQAESPALLEQRYNSLVALLETDISITDFFAQRDMLHTLLTNGTFAIDISAF